VLNASIKHQQHVLLEQSSLAVIFGGKPGRQYLLVGEEGKDREEVAEKVGDAKINK
jgi:hypothetical protein